MLAGAIEMGQGTWDFYDVFHGAIWSFEASDHGVLFLQDARTRFEDAVERGTMLPCNVIVQELRPNEVEVAATDPVASMVMLSP